MSISSEFFQNKFEPIPIKSYLNGLNTIEYNSIIMFHDEIWKFCYFKSGSDISIFMNKNGELLEINLQKAQNVTRMKICS